MGWGVELRGKREAGCGGTHWPRARDLSFTWSAVSRPIVRRTNLLNEGRTPVAILSTTPSLAPSPPAVKGTLGDTQLSHSFSPALTLTGASLPPPPEKLHCCQRCQSLQEDQQLGGTDGSGGLSPRSGGGPAAAARRPGLRPHSPEGQSRRARPQGGLARTRLHQAWRLRAPHAPASPMTAASDVV